MAQNAVRYAKKVGRDFTRKTNWATHKSDWRGNWSPEVARKLILRYSKEKDHLLDCMGVEPESGVGAQPATDNETKQGAENRVKNARCTNREAEYVVGFEGGIEDKCGAMGSFAWVCVEDKSGKVGFARTGTFFLSQAIRKLIMEGKEL